MLAVINWLLTLIDEQRGEIERLKEQRQGYYNEAADGWVKFRQAESQLAAEQAKFEAHTKAVEQFLSDLYCIMIDPLVEGEIKVDDTTKVLLEQARKDRESLFQLTTKDAEIEELKQMLQRWETDPLQRIESYASLKVAEQKRKDVEFAEDKAREWRKLASAAFHKKDYSTASAWGCWYKAASKVKQAIEKGANDG